MVSDLDIEDIKKLGPDERIKKLKELEEKRKQEIERAHKLIQESEDEIAIEEKLKDVKIPDDKEVDIGKLFRQEDETLEETVAKEKPEINEEELQNQRQYLANVTTARIEERAEYLRNAVEDRGYLTNQQRTEIEAMYQEVHEREEALHHGRYKSVSENIEETISMTKRILGDLYKR